MNIQPLKNQTVPASPKAAKPAKPSETASADEPKAEGKSESHLAALAQAPDVRTDEVVRGKALAADPKYPSDEMLAKLAEVLVNCTACKK